MKKVLMMMLADCPHCKRANQMIEELQSENPKYAAIEIQREDEEKNTALADSLDYYYVPCFFVDGEKLMEGVPSKEKIEMVLQAACEKEER
ncbi:MAG: thioredoxin family protein [Hespellia sp.]|nr:thioredoxin family protein [Hespellia sp.]